MNLLCMDVKKHIASFDAYAWLKLYTYDEEFKVYACTKYGINNFIRTFTKQIKEYIGYATKLELLNCLHSVDDLPAWVTDRFEGWYCMGELHRDNDLPAIIYIDGFKSWYQHGLVHRDNDQYAVIYSGGDKHWYYYNKLHRENDQPAIITKGGDKYWYYNDVKHRENDLPAIIFAGGRQVWFHKGLCHRENNLPAIIDGNGRAWYKDGVMIRSEGF